MELNAVYFADLLTYFQIFSGYLSAEIYPLIWNIGLPSHFAENVSYLPQIAPVIVTCIFSTQHPIKQCLWLGGVDDYGHD